MSSTGRGSTRSPGDFYRTPSWCVEAIAPHLAVAGPFDLVIDPGCGDGGIAAGLRAAGWTVPILGIETHPTLAARAREVGDYQHVREGDFLSLDASEELLKKRTIAIGNPPYSKSLEFVRAALKLSRNVAMLLRLPWAAGQRRSIFHRSRPSDLFVLSKRPSFTGRGTDSCDYAWFVWGPGPRGRWVVL